ncbi:chromosome partitioning protein [Bacillus ectoiniformans]|uniref:ParA family protein n=1 Tax=Bacillus ectoiniformans TaxID=1494429 RepID=UPI00195E16D6|nr:ParA family protein [Bacillus ectoiniformans]MBM7650536.1 chromosome partitioning protein [Bacillus ectoiniformans]
MARIIAFVNQKGGVAKTTSTANIGAGLSSLGKRVMLVDLDPQGNLTASLGITAHELDNTINEVLIGTCTITEATEIINDYHVIPADIRLSGAEIELSTQAGREMILKEALQPIINRYDYILIDCPPSLSLLTLNSLTAANEIIIPLQAEYLALHGMGQILKTTDTVKKRLNPSLKITGIIATFYDRRKKLNREVLKKIAGYFPDKLYKTKIRNNVALSEAQSYGIDVFQYKPKSNGALDYAALCKEIIKQEEMDNE